MYQSIKQSKQLLSDNTRFAAIQNAVLKHCNMDTIVTVSTKPTTKSVYTNMHPTNTQSDLVLL